ncbi:MAG: hypothetical protein NC489_21415 [Ruminococcus flavefaciens]|nr:hypothetical protein [Ruminococcus flavefaciens]
MKKAKAAAVILGTGLLCAAGIVAGSYAKERLIEEAVQEAQKQQQEARQQAGESKPGYILIHTTDGEAWGFYGDMVFISDGTDGGDIDIDMSGWLVGSTHDCYNTDPEE